MTNFATEDMKENIRAMFVYVATKYRIVGKRSNILNRIFIPSLQ